MSFFDRFRTTVVADAHGVIDALEDRALILRQCLREAEAELARKRAQLQAIELENRGLVREAARLDENLAALDTDANLAMQAGQEELARYALKRLLSARARKRRGAERQQQLAESRRDLEALLQQQEQRYEELRARVQAAVEGADAAGCADSVSDEQVELELLRRKASKEQQP